MLGQVGLRYKAEDLSKIFCDLTSCVGGTRLYAELCSFIFCHYVLLHLRDTTSGTIPGCSLIKKCVKLLLETVRVNYATLL